MPLDILGNKIISVAVSPYGVYRSRIIRDGLILELDAGDLNSYPGSGSTWYDLSGKGNNYSIGAAVTWNSAGYFVLDGSGTSIFTGPASNAASWGFNVNCENYVEVWIQMTTLQPNTFFSWRATPNTGANTRAIQTHLGYDVNGVTYYDVAGCCDPVQRISVNIAGLTSLCNVSYRTRVNGYPNRQIFKNMVSQVDSGTYNTATVTWNDSTSAIIGASWIGKIYLIRVYNRPLNPYEMAENFQATRGRIGI